MNFSEVLKKKKDQRIKVLKAGAGKRRGEPEKVAFFASHFFFGGLRQIILLPGIHNFIFFSMLAKLQQAGSHKVKQLLLTHVLCSA